MLQVSNSIDLSAAVTAAFFLPKIKAPCAQGAPESGLSFFGGFDVSRFPLLMKSETV